MKFLQCVVVDEYGAEHRDNLTLPVGKKLTLHATRFTIFPEASNRVPHRHPRVWRESACDGPGFERERGPG